MNRMMKRALCIQLVLILALLSVPTLAETDTSYVTTVAGIPAYRSVFDARLHFYAEGFPQDGAAHYTDWQALLDRVSVKGTVDTQRMLDPYSRVYMNAAILLDDEELIPYEYDGYYSYRYVRSPALGKTSLHFQMSNFLEFMLKAYYYMDLPTPWIGLTLYPEESVYWAQRYREACNEVIGNEKNVSYEELYDLCMQLDDYIWGETEYRAYYYVTAALVDLGENDRLLNQLGSLENILDMLDPEFTGMRITKKGNTTVYTIGETDILTREVSEDHENWYFQIPDTDGYQYSVSLNKTNSELHLQGEMLCGEESILGVQLDLDGMQAFGNLGGRGQASIAFTGSGLREPMLPIVFEWSLLREASQLPFEETLTLDWIHPQTGDKAIGLEYHAHMSEQDASILVERSYDNQDDLFHMNEGVLEELKETVLPSLVVYSFPLLTAIPSGVISDVVAFMASSGFMAFIGIE